MQMNMNNGKVTAKLTCEERAVYKWLDDSARKKEVAREGYLGRVASSGYLEVEFHADLKDPRVVAEDQTRLIEEVQGARIDRVHVPHASRRHRIN